MPYIPQYAKPLTELNKGWQQIRVVLQGPSRGGKTTSSLTFPNPVVLDFDRNLAAHYDRDDVFCIPFHDANFVSEVLKFPKTKPHSKHPNRRDALVQWLTTEGYKLQQDQTLVIDSWTSVQSHFDYQQELEPVYTKAQEIDFRAFWAAKIEHSENLCNIFKALNCHVVVCCHEQGTRNDKGEVLEKLSPLMQGKFPLQMSSHFTDMIAALVRAKKGPDGKPLKDAKGELIPEYYWQVRSDDLRNLGGRAKFETAVVTPHYDSLAPFYGLPLLSEIPKQSVKSILAT